MAIKGKIIDIQEDGTVLIEAELPIDQIIHQEATHCYVEIIDGRTLSDNQRKMCYAMIHAIASWSGSTDREIKDALKLEFWAEHTETLADKIFSLSDAPMSLVAEFQKFLVNFIIENGIPTKRPLLEYADDIDHYVYMCLINKKCAVCGRRADLHHIDTVGMGNDRTQISHIGKEVMSLCRNHHEEFHKIGKDSFFSLYHFNKGISCDRTICKIYGLKE